MTVWDYECDTCDRREERWDEPPPAIPCSCGPCGGTMSRVMGGRPRKPQAASSAPATRTVPALFFGYLRVPVKTRSDA